jgi:hypothetical protein|tara:strand:- start:11199 stop:11591 length:393 start_codon:yes stop_codon:yes gene_type:complete
MSDMNIINRRLEIQDKLIGDILCTAFEGGITYWANNVSCKDKEDMQKVGGYKHEYLTKTKLKDAIMYIHESETGEKYPITKKSIIDALQKMDTPEYRYTEALNRLLNGDWDAIDADIVVQTACFGEVVYG